MDNLFVTNRQVETISISNIIICLLSQIRLFSRGGVPMATETSLDAANCSKGALLECMVVYGAQTLHLIKVIGEMRTFNYLFNTLTTMLSHREGNIPLMRW